MRSTAGPFGPALCATQYHGGSHQLCAQLHWARAHDGTTLGKLAPTPEPDPYEEADRGRLAAAPVEIPLKGWRDVLWRVAKGIVADRVFAIAAGVAYYALLAVFPAITMAVSLYALFSDVSTVSRHLLLLSGIMPPGSTDLLAEPMIRIAAQSTHTLGLAFITSFLVSLWSANAGMSALFDALNVVYKEKEKRPLWRFYATTLLFTLIAIGFLAVAIGAIVVVPLVLNLFGWGTYSERLIAFLRWPGLFLVVSVGLTVIYRYGPSRKRAKWRWINGGSAIAAGLWIGASMLFSWYVSNFDSYNRMYGSIGAVVAFQIWLWLSSVIVLLGAEFNAEAEHQTAMDSTEGLPKPMGRRGAVMADTIGETQS
jgi:membrane protein